VKKKEADRKPLRFVSAFVILKASLFADISEVAFTAKFFVGYRL
jgi:hypothetical protein